MRIPDVHIITKEKDGYYCYAADRIVFGSMGLYSPCQLEYKVKNNKLYFVYNLYDYEEDDYKDNYTRCKGKIVKIYKTKNRYQKYNKYEIKEYKDNYEI